jgi:hypothetical protein
MSALGRSLYFYWTFSLRTFDAELYFPIFYLILCETKVEGLITSALCHYVPYQIWSKNIKAKSIDLTALKKHGKVYEDGKRSLQTFVFYIFFNVIFVWPTETKIQKIYSRFSCPSTIMCLYRTIWLPGVVSLRDPSPLCGRKEEA